MKHTVIFKNRENRWDNALPLGNGVLGAMLFYHKNSLSMPLNHYEVYYNINGAVLPADKLASFPADDGQGAQRHQKIRDLADNNVPVGDEPYCDYTYRKERQKAMDDSRDGVGELSHSYPCTGELVFDFDEAVTGGDHTLALYTEDARVCLQLQKGDTRLEMDAIIPREDCVLNRFTLGGSHVRALSLRFPRYRIYDYPQITYTQLAGDLFAYTVKRRLKITEKDFVFSGIIRLLGAEGTLQEETDGARIILTRCSDAFTVLTGIFTQWHYPDPLADGVEKTALWASQLPRLYDEHKAYWADFFGKSAISIPDKFLEHVYYVNQYALGSCSGKDGVMKHHACGLNGLWAIRHPNIWGSMWYWDVNIQASFAGVFSSNRLDLGKVFSDGLLSYRDLMRWYARYYHGLDGCAADYPYNFYYCVVPWCTMYLWHQYEYSQDKEYLKNEAYPFFLEVCRFVTQIFRYDEAAGYYRVYPDISPEQGPLAHDTTITVATCKYLLKFTLEAAEILGDTDPLLETCRKILAKMPPYAVSGPGYCGPHLKDSADAADNMFIRHPSMLMPLFPIGELSLDSGKEMVEILNNTLEFLEQRCEIGIFGGSWLAASAARLGRGQMALRLLYERGIDHMLRSNGLTAEETERFLNFCLIQRQPLYYPCMMEFTGEMLAAVNEMLLQSYNGLIRVFPALPDGDKEYYRLHRNGDSYHTWPDRYIPYDAWKDVRFDRLLAKGAFEISAEVKDGKLQFITVHSQKGGRVNITSPLLTGDMPIRYNGKPVGHTYANGILSFDTQPGGLYQICADTALCTPEEAGSYHEDVLCRETYTRRHIYIGEDPETGYHKALDGFIRDRFFGNQRLPSQTVYKFDFGTDDKKHYSDTFRRQTHAYEERTENGMPPLFVKDLQFTPYQGYGFADAAGITAADRGEPDGLRRDFVQGDRNAAFLIEVPRGQYDLFVVSGDACEDSVTTLDLEYGPTTGGDVIPAGRYQCKVLPLVLEEDGLIRLRLSTKPGYRWKLNYLFLNCVKGY